MTAIALAAAAAIPATSAFADEAGIAGVGDVAGAADVAGEADIAGDPIHDAKCNEWGYTKLEKPENTDPVCFANWGDKDIRVYNVSAVWAGINSGFVTVEGYGDVPFRREIAKDMIEEFGHTVTITHIHIDRA